MPAPAPFFLGHVEGRTVGRPLPGHIFVGPGNVVGVGIAVFPLFGAFYL